MKRVAVVTGSNRGIGYAIVRGLCKQFDGDVFLTARDEVKGQEAVVSLQKEGLDPKFHQLDVEDNSSIERLKEYLVLTYGGLDILVNNVGILYPRDSTEPIAIQAKVTIQTNYCSMVTVLNTMMPILKSGARVVNMSSVLGSMALHKCNDAIQKKVREVKSIDDVTDLMTNFVQSMKHGMYEQEGWTPHTYGVSKIGVSMLSSIIQKQMDADESRSDMVLNACCPGYVITAFTNYTGFKTPDEGAMTPLYLALLPANIKEPKGEFVTEKKIEDWLTYVHTG